MSSRLLLVSMLVVGCKKSTPRSATAPSDPSLVFEVRKGDAVSHLMGTCHLPLTLESRVDPALIRSARGLWIEARIDDVKPTEMMGLIWDEQRSLSKEMDRTAFTTATRTAGAALPASMAEHFAPWMVGVTLGMDRLLTAEQLQEMSGGGVSKVLDARVVAEAKQAGVPIHTVETLEEQLEMMAESSGLEDLLEMLTPTAEQDQESSATGQALLDLCTKNDLSVLPPEMYAESPVMLDDRNLRWMTPLTPEVEQGGVFIAVGALHLPGPNGLIAQFQKRGFEVVNLPRPEAAEAAPVFKPLERTEIVLMPVEQRDMVANKVAETLCVEGQVARSCFQPDEMACRAELAADTALCLDQAYSTLEEVAAGGNPNVDACVLSGMVGRAMAEGFPDREACAPLKAAMP